MRKIQASRLHRIDGPVIENGILVLDDEGRIVDILGADAQKLGDVERYEGDLLPGFVNAHCHLELSHMLHQVDTGTGLIPFIKGVVTKRGMAQELIDSAIAQADADMWDAGIQAVGDISNQVDTFAIKEGSNIYYYTFVECFDFLQEGQAKTEFAKYKAVYDALPKGAHLRGNLVPHAPYSVSPELFSLIKQSYKKLGQPLTVSIHNQETPSENALFETGGGGFPPFYEAFGMSVSHFKAPGSTAIHYALRHMDPKQRSLFVHNTLTTAEDLAAAQAWSENTYWASCPNANLYIENRLPDYSVFLEGKAKVCLGTDSLTSNWQLSILEEVKTIARLQSYVPMQDLWRWATLNGAEALGFDAELGSLSVGKKPGVLLIQGLDAQGRPKAETQVRRLV